MAKFKFYIVSLADGSVSGTDDEDIALGLSGLAEYVIIESDMGILHYEEASMDIEKHGSM